MVPFGKELLRAAWLPPGKTSQLLSEAPSDFVSLSLCFFRLWRFLHVLSQFLPFRLD